MHILYVEPRLQSHHFFRLCVCRGTPCYNFNTLLGFQSGGVPCPRVMVSDSFGEIRVNVKFTHPNSRIHSRILAPLVLGAVCAWWMLLGRDLHWMMCNEAGRRIVFPQIPQKDPIIWRFPSKNLIIWVNSREIHAFIQTATYPPFTKGTRRQRRRRRRRTRRAVMLPV